jgi:hypothetical protein
MFDQAVRILGCDHLQEITAANLPHAITEVFELLGSCQGKMARDDDAIEAVQGADDQAGELDQKAPDGLQGILPKLVEVSNYQFDGRMPFFALPALVAATPRWDCPQSR